MEQLLIIEDDIGLNQGLCKALKADDRQIISCQDLKAAKEQLRRCIPDPVGYQSAGWQWA
jgi:DNA-binding response OmpR family regulator